MLHKNNLPRIIADLLMLKEKGECRFDYATDRSFSKFCTFRIGGRIAHLFIPQDIPSLCLLFRTLRLGGVPCLVLGGGSNVLPHDDGYAGAVVLTSHLRQIRVFENRLYAACGATLNDCILASAGQGLSGMECLYGIPATVGGAIYMNAGANGMEISDRLERVELYDPDADVVFHLSPLQMCFSYRESILHIRRNLVVLGATFVLTPKDSRCVMQTVRDVTQKRLRSQPLQYPSAGSAFKRPRSDTEAWRLIDGCGLRGHCRGGAQISEKHAGFIINRGGATAEDVRTLITHVRREVLHTTGVLLIPEIEILENGK
ncbi:MAG: UDP-N-acetylmuramate dehydrogenase [Clostridia bacterium]|nr:UDP-N-acetylmuramate dehydrogenase [Clostridia bacterium]